MGPRPIHAGLRGTCFAWGPSRNHLKGPMLDGTGPLLCLEIEQSGESDGSWPLRRAGSAGVNAETHRDTIEGVRGVAGVGEWSQAGA